MGTRAVLIAIHPGYAEEIVAGIKRLEFRRSWAAMPVDILVIYATSPVQRIVALAEVKQVFFGSRTELWNIARKMGGGISRRKLFSYLDGKRKAVAIEITEVKPITGGLDPTMIFGYGFRPPQSFRYLKNEEYLHLGKLVRK